MSPRQMVAATYHIPAALQERLRRAAHHTDTSQAEIVRDGIEFKLNRLEDRWRNEHPENPTFPPVPKRRGPRRKT
jgi:predicted DNA-binding protein